jgi:pimeloyl-ACP methyl ester carboxylesterase
VLGATNPGEVWYQVINGKNTFLDPSGEFFRRLSFDYRQQFGLPDLTEEDFHFMKRATEALAGVVLVFDLTQTVDQRNRSAWRQQENEFNFILSSLRWLRWDKEARPDKLSVVVNIAQRAKSLPRIDKPVLVLFSKADQLTRITPGLPLQFAKQRLPVLHGAVMTHARRFRYDFCHTMIRKDGQDREVDHPCGVLLPIEWVLDVRFQWLPMQLPSRLFGGGGK